MKNRGELMKKIYRFLLGLILITLLVACSKEEASPREADVAEEQAFPKEAVEELQEDHDHDDHEEEEAALDYTKLDQAIEQVLKEIPSFSIQNEVDRDAAGDLFNYFNADKMEFRLKVESILGNQEYDSSELVEYAEYYVKENLLAIDIAKKKYNIEVTQAEVTNFINDNVKEVVPEEKKLYAKSIGITLEELDTIFDRDIYIMDMLWSKLTPMLMEEYPQAVGESEVEYMLRLTNEFFEA